MDKSNIHLELEGLSQTQLEQMRSVIDAMFEANVFFIRNGKVILHFDNEGKLQEIAVDNKRWKRKKLM